MKCVNRLLVEFCSLRKDLKCLIQRLIISRGLYLILLKINFSQNLNPNGHGLYNSISFKM